MPSKKTTTPARAAGRAATPVPTLDHRHPATPLDDSHRDPPPDPLPPRADDPADVMASILVESAVVENRLAPDDLRGTAIVHVRLADPAWVQPVRRAWTALISGTGATSLAEVEGATRRVGGLPRSSRSPRSQEVVLPSSVG